MVKDAQRTPVGYVCPYYVKSRVSRFYTAGTSHYVIAGVLSVICGIGLGFLLRLVGSTAFSLYIMLFGGPAVGGVIAEIIRRSLQKKRGKYIWLVSAIGVVLGAGVFVVLPLLFGNIGSLWGLIGLALAIGTMIARLRGSISV